MLRPTRLRRNNQIVNDPQEQQPGGRAKDFQFIDGSKAKGFSRSTPPIPQRILGDVEDIAAPLVGGDPTTAIKSAVKVIGGRAVPGVGAALDAGITAYSPAKDPTLPQNYNTVYDKDAPRGVQARQIGGYIAGKAPIPLLGYQVKDAIRTGKPMTLHDIESGVTGIQSYPETSKQSDKAEYRVRKQLETKVSRANKIQDPDRKKPSLRKPTPSTRNG